VLLWGDPSFDQAGFQIDQTEHYYAECNDGLVRFSLNDTFNYLPVELEN
jgi:hypothetical protein